MALKAGARLGAYEILAPIGAGGMGEVYRARDTKLGREVAIKVLPEGFSEEEARRARFERGAPFPSRTLFPSSGKSPRDSRGRTARASSIET